MGEKERMKGGVVKVAAYGESCQNHKDTHSRLQLPGLQSFNKVPAGILKLGETLGLICRHAMHTQTHTFTAKKMCTYTPQRKHIMFAKCKCGGVNLGLYQY